MAFKLSEAPAGGFKLSEPAPKKGFSLSEGSGFKLSSEPEETADGLFGTKMGTRESPLPVVSDIVGKLTGVSPQDASNAIMVAAREPGRLARKGFDFIPNVPEAQHRSAALNFLQNLAGGTEKVAKEVTASMVDPESAVVAGAGEILRPLAKAPFVQKGIAKAGEFAAEKLPTLSRFLTYRFGQPAAYKEMAEQRIANIGAGAEKAGETGTALSEGLSRAEQLRTGQILKGGVSVSAKEQPLRQIAKTARDQLTSLGSEAVSEGLLDQNTFLKNVKEYMPRLYRKYESAAGGGAAELFGSKPQRILGKRFLQREEIPEAVRSFMGEIKEPAYPVARGIAQLTHDVETAKLFRNVATNPDWASATPMKDFVQLDSTKRLGALAGKYVHPEIARDINEIIKIPSTAEKVYKDILHAWKFGKVVLNPATHARNMMSNAILLDMSGVELHQQPALIARALKEVTSKGTFFKEAKEANLLGHEFSNTEIKGFIDNFDKPAETIFGKLMNIPKKSASFLGRTYQGEEQVFKLAKFIHGREAGLGVKEAADQAEKWLFNYDKVSPFIKKLRSHYAGAPFVTFTSKALPVVAETALKNPMKIYKYKILFDSMENMAREKFDLSDKEVNAIKRNQRGTVVILPFKDKNGQLQTLDLSYILPWGDIGEQGGMFGLPPSMSPGGLLKPFGEVAANKSLFKAGSSKYDPVKAQIYLDSDPGWTKVRKQVDYLYKSFMPSFAPPIPGVEIPDPEFSKIGGKIIKVSGGGYHTQKLIDAQEGRPDYFGRVRSVATVLADIFLGLKVSPVDPKIMEQFERVGMKKELDEIRREVKGKFRNKGASADEKIEARDVLRQKLQVLLEKKSRAEE